MYSWFSAGLTLTQLVEHNVEDRVIASLTRDTNKCDVFIKGYDSHCMNSLGFFKDEIAKYMPLTGDLGTDVLEFARLCESGHKELKDIRQKSKPATLTNKRLCTAMYIENHIYAGNSH